MAVNTRAVAAAVLDGVGLLGRRVRQVRVAGDLTLAERNALSRLSRMGPATSAELARAEQISPQSMGVTLSGLETKGHVKRGNDPNDGRRVVFSFTKAGQRSYSESRNARAEAVAEALATSFTEAEIEQLAAAAPLLERLASKLPL